MYSNFLMNKLTHFFLAAAFLVLVNAPAYAQINSQTNTNTSTDSVTDTASGLEISPAIIEISGKPGITVTKEVKITNPLDKEVILYPLSRDFYTDDQDGTPLFYNDDEDQAKSTYQLSKWITFIEESITLKAKETRQVEYTITIPKDGEPGGHYAGVMFSTSKPTATTGGSTQVGAVGLITSLVFLTVDGAITEQLQIKDFKATKFTYSKPVEFDVVVNNTGNVHVTPKGFVKVSNWQGKDVKSIEINTKSGKALPKAERKFSDKWEPSWKNVGYYNLTASITYGQNNTLIDRTVRVLVLPIWFIATVSVLLLLIIILIIRHFRGGKDEDILGDTPAVKPTPAAPVTPTAPATTPVIAPQPAAPAVEVPAPAAPAPAPTATPAAPAPAATTPPAVEPAPAPAPSATTEPSVNLEVNAPVVPTPAPKIKKTTPPTDPSAPSA